MTITVDPRPGDKGVGPTDRFGFALVKLSNGNLRVGAATPGLPAVGGPLGVRFTCNSGDNPASRTRADTYDGAGRPGPVAFDDGGGVRRWAWHANSNRCADGPACDGSYAYDAADRLLASPLAAPITAEVAWGPRRCRGPSRARWAWPARRSSPSPSPATAASP